MGKIPDWVVATDVADIMESMADHFSQMFEGFDVGGVDCIMTTVKRPKAKAVRLIARTYPDIIFHTDKPYIVEVFDQNWEKMTQTQKNLAVFHVMCAVPVGGFDPESEFYAKKVKPDIVMYMREFAASGGVPNWMENPMAQDPMARTAEDVAKDVPAFSEEEDPLPSGDGDGDRDGGVKRVPVTPSGVAAVA